MLDKKPTHWIPEIGDCFTITLSAAEARAIVDELRPCQTCNDDPEVCSTVPGLRHCEAANRHLEGDTEAAVMARIVRCTTIAEVNAIWDEYQRNKS